MIIATNSVVIRAPAQAGLFYGVKTLLQLSRRNFLHKSCGRHKLANSLRPDETGRDSNGADDVDVSRHFFKDRWKKSLDEMALHKLNTLPGISRTTTAGA